LSLHAKFPLKKTMVTDFYHHDFAVKIVASEGGSQPHSLFRKRRLMNTHITQDQLNLMRSLPKAEVHAHLEGCFEAATLAQWAKESGTPLPRPLETLFQFEGLADFLHFLDWACGLAAPPERLAELSYAYCQRLAQNGGGYADIIINPTHWKAWHGRLGSMIDAIDAGFTAAEQDGLPSVGLCVSLLRTQTGDAAIELVDRLVAMRHPRIVALSIDGNEAAAGRTGSRFAEAFRRAGAAGLKRTVHAGESSGPEGVRDAIEMLGADRIDHGVRAIDDPELVALLVEKQIPLGICPTSNLVLGVYPSLEQHPVEKLRRAGVLVSLNTDDPALLGASLAGEYAICRQAFEWSDSITCAVAHTSIDACFANDDIKARLKVSLRNWETSRLTVIG
jgi:adenosine deaminase